MMPPNAPTEEQQRGRDDAVQPLRRILVADDEPDHREMIVRAVGSARAAATAEIIECGDGNAAWRSLQDGVDLAFLDIQMPGMDGLTLLERAAANGVSETPIVIVTSSTDPRDQNRAMAAGARAYVPKVRYSLLRAELVRLTDDTLAGSAAHDTKRKPL